MYPSQVSISRSKYSLSMTFINRSVPIKREVSQKRWWCDSIFSFIYVPVLTAALIAFPLTMPGITSLMDLCCWKSPSWEKIPNTNNAKSPFIKLMTTHSWLTFFSARTVCLFLNDCKITVQIAKGLIDFVYRKNFGKL